MKCEMIRDLMPLYIDRLTSEESNQEIEKHLKSCPECKAYYQEMTGEINEIVLISDEEIQEVELIKKMKKRKTRGIIAGIISASAVVIGVIVLILPHTYSTAKYEEVNLIYGTKENTAYMTMEPKLGYDIVVSGNNTYLKVLSIQRSFSPTQNSMGWESEIGTEENPCKWTIEFADKIVYFENGQLVEERDK